MDILELMHKRHSVRKYIDEEIDNSVKEIIEQKVDEVNRESSLNIRAVLMTRKVLIQSLRSMVSLKM